MTAAVVRASFGSRAWAFGRTHRLELLVFAVGVCLRLSMAWNYHERWSYDTDFHWEVVEWIAKHGRVPQAETLFESFHPPLYYATAAGLLSLGLTRSSMVAFSIACGILRLAVIWAGLELLLPRSRWARVTALGLAATVAASVHLDGMVYSEAMSCLLCAVVMLLVPLAFRQKGAERWPLCSGIGLVLGLAVLTKISGFLVLGVVGLGVIIEIFWVKRSLAERFHNALPWLSTLAICLGVSGWYYARNMREYGTPVVTSFTLPSQRWVVEKATEVPIPERRRLGFLVPFDLSIYRDPFRPSGYAENPRFFSLAIASSVVDYWQFGFQGYRQPWASKPSQGGAQPINAVRPEGRLATVGGTLIFWAVVSAWLLAAAQVVKQRDIGRLTLLLMLPGILAMSLHFAVAYPIDNYGVVKGVYMTFAAPPFYALYGVTCGWAKDKPSRWPLLLALLVALVFVAAYSVRCRLGVPLLPVG